MRRTTRRQVRRPDPHPSGATSSGRPVDLVPAPRRDRHGRQRPLGQGARAAAHGGPRAGRALALRRGRGRDRDRREGDLGVRLLDRELVALARRGEVPDGLQPRRDPAPPRRDARARRPGAMGGPHPTAVALGDQGAPGRRGADPGQRRAHADDVRQLRRSRRARRRRPLDRRRDVAAGRLNADRIDERTFARYLYVPELPDADMVWRTSGEQRLSQLHAVAGGVLRDGLHRRALARRRPPPPVGRRSRPTPAATAATAEPGARPAN